MSTETKTAIELTPVESSQIAAIGYDPATKTLAVKFKSGNGGLYHYSNFEPEHWAEFQSAKSKGSHFIQNIKRFPDKFPFKKQ